MNSGSLDNARLLVVARVVTVEWQFIYRLKLPVCLKTQNAAECHRTLQDAADPIKMLHEYDKMTIKYAN